VNQAPLRTPRASRRPRAAAREPLARRPRPLTRCRRRLSPSFSFPTGGMDLFWTGILQGALSYTFMDPV